MTASTIKSGDKVRFKDNEDDQDYRALHYKGTSKDTVFEVERAQASWPGITYLKGYSAGSFTSRLELVPEATFKVGDKVRVKDNIPADWWFKPGDEAVVSAVLSACVDRVTLKFNRKSLAGSTCGYVLANQIELVEATDPKTLKVGDKVRFKDNEDDQAHRRQWYPKSLANTVFTITKARADVVNLDDIRFVSCRERLELVEAATETVVRGAKPATVIADEVATKAPVKGVPLAAHIVVLRDSKGKLKPSNSPFVHTSKAAALAEAKRLAKENPGQTFVVFSSSSEATATVPAVEVTAHAAA